MYAQFYAMSHGKVGESPHVSFGRNQQTVYQQDCEGLYS